MSAFGRHLIDSGYYDITPEQEREMEEREEFEAMRDEIDALRAQLEAARSDAMHAVQALEGENAGLRTQLKAARAEIERMKQSPANSGPGDTGEEGHEKASSISNGVDDWIDNRG